MDVVTARASSNAKSSHPHGKPNSTLGQVEPERSRRDGFADVEWQEQTPLFPAELSRASTWFNPSDIDLPLLARFECAHPR